MCFYFYKLALSVIPKVYGKTFIDQVLQIKVHKETTKSFRLIMSKNMFE